MSIHLYKHNEDAYRAVETMLEEKQMAAVIHPTGTGKSMIAFKLVEQHPHKHFLWLSPSEYIYKTQLENIDTQFSNIEYISYSRLMKHEDSIDTLRPDYIILDEFHRCGAAEWGKSVKSFCKHIRTQSAWGSQRQTYAIWITSAIWQRSSLRAT